MAVVGGYFKDRLWVIQSFWSIFYRKILWYHLNFAIVTLVIYGHRLPLVPLLVVPHICLIAVLWATSPFGIFTMVR